MLEANRSAQLLVDALGKYGVAELKYATSLFSGKRSEKADISGSIKSCAFRVIMFEAAVEHGIPCASAHFTMNLNSRGITQPQIAFWNTDNRFTKMYQQDEDTLLVMDQLVPADDGRVAEGAATVWASALDELSRFKRSFERSTSF